MTLSQIMQPFVVFIDWMRTRTFYLGEYPFTLWDWVVWSMLATIVITAIIKLKE